MELCFNLNLLLLESRSHHGNSLPNASFNSLFLNLFFPQSIASSRVTERGVHSLKPVNLRHTMKSLFAPLNVYNDGVQHTTFGDKSDDMASNEYKRNLVMYLQREKLATSKV